MRVVHISKNAKPKDDTQVFADYLVEKMRRKAKEKSEKKKSKPNRA